MGYGLNYVNSKAVQVFTILKATPCIPKISQLTTKPCLNAQGVVRLHINLGGAGEFALFIFFRSDGVYNMFAR